jgi:hypothetical protein
MTMMVGNLASLFESKSEATRHTTPSHQAMFSHRSAREGETLTNALLGIFC